MTVKKHLIYLFAFIALLIGGCKAMTHSKQDHEEVVTLMKSYAENKYQTEFTTSTFFPALGDTYYDTLTLVDAKDRLINVYHSGSDEQYERMFDDYPEAIIDHKFTEAFKQAFKLDFVNVHINLKDEPKAAVDIENTPIEELLKEYEVSDIIMVIACSQQEISLSKDELFAAYQKLTELQPDYLDFEVIHVNEKTEALLRTITNIRAYYSKDWSLFPEVSDYISVSSLEIQSADELVSYCKNNVSE